MVFYAGKLIHDLDNPTIVVITDRNDLDQQLFDTFAASSGLLGQPPVQAESREHLKSLLKVASGGIVFTTIQKFFPENNRSQYDRLSERRNIIVIADEAHRTQYGFQAKMIDKKDDEGKVNGKRIAYGFAKYLRDAVPNATFIGFTGTPVEGTDINTPLVFGDYIDIYDIARAVEDGATVKIYYESRLAKVNLTEEGRRLIEEYEREMEDDGASEVRKAKAKWTKLEAIVGHPERLKILARDIIAHYERRAEVFDGKAMIVTMSRRIAVALYDEIIKIRHEWHSEDLNVGALKVVMTSSSSDKMEFDPEDPDSMVIPAFHRTNKEDRRVLSNRMKDPQDSLKLVIVRDMWLTGFDVPCLHTLYIDKLMKKHTLMQAIARVNRVFLDKPGGLVVDYIGIGNALKDALAFYSNSGGKGDPAETQAKALEMLERSIKKYQNNLLSTAEIIEELLVIARQIRTVDGLAEKLKLSKDEFAFYTALEINDSAVKVLGDETLKNIAREIAEKVHKNATIDWAMKESARAKLMVIVKRTLNKYGYPPDKQQKAVDTVLKQAEVLADYWVEQ